MQKHSPKITELYDIQDDPFEEEKNINCLEHDYESSSRRGPAAEAGIKLIRNDLVDKHKPRVIEIMGATGLTTDQ